MGLLCGGIYWTDLFHDFSDQALAPQNLVLLWVLFPLLKLCHELGHGFMAKAFGAEVHELGVMLLIFTPFPTSKPPRPGDSGASGSVFSSAQPA